MVDGAHCNAQLPLSRSDNVIHADAATLTRPSRPSGERWVSVMPPEDQRNNAPL
jgi:hypothetical protein